MRYAELAHCKLSINGSYIEKGRVAVSGRLPVRSISLAAISSIKKERAEG
jgi:hypothetical protein